jgi:hypothetical protein
MRFDDERDASGRATSLTDEVVNEDDSDEDSEVDDEDERPDDAVECLLYDTPWHLGDECELCGGRNWTTEEVVEDHLGTNRVGCLNCGGEGEVSPAPVSFTCLFCLGTTRMPVAALAEQDLTQDPIHEQDWSDADLQGQDLRGAVFVDCTFTGVNFAGADLADATFRTCEFTGANPELAASLDGTRLQVAGLSEEQLVACAARGAIVLDEMDEPAE